MGDSPVRTVEAVIMYPFHGPSGTEKRVIVAWFEAGYAPLQSDLDALKRHVQSKQDRRFLYGTLRVLRGDGGCMLAFELSAGAPHDAEPIANALQAVIKQHLGVTPKLRHGKAGQIFYLVPKSK